MEERVLSGLKQRLLAPDLLAQFAEENRKAFNDAADGACQDRQKAEHSLKKLKSRIAKHPDRNRGRHVHRLNEGQDV
ncbi:hypothetical protein [Leisingera sp. ANG-Vp]|uniref:hypothetical protein n=1 Tax=Leisingera sp. ANG-Vp TaxID=1577896 RepID=UPI001F4D0C83|nr:hypothetical protein [Leisingera sp. ANG-Vp]